MSDRPACSRSFVALTLLFAAALYFSIRLSAGDRGMVDYVVMGLLGAAVVYGLARLARRLHVGSHADRDAWQVLRTAGFWVIGLMNTVWIRPEDVGSWKHWVGGLVLVIAILDTLSLARKEQAVVRGRADAGSGPGPSTDAGPAN